MAESHGGQEDLPIRVRKAIPRDVSFITSSWLRSFRDAPMVEGVPNTVYYYEQHKILDELIPRATVLVACSDDDPDVILGWICLEKVDTGTVLHYVYVKEAFRRFGVATRLLETFLTMEEDQRVFYSHKPRFDTVAARILKNPYKKYRKNWMYNPYVLFSKLEDHEDQTSRVSKLYPKPFGR